ncbi:hypothetical protein [Olsenella sp. HMSC062G07]|uniref:hypothetical protein n=1 Tax=Olsenella sp. HMSC062G07 TaxID=1739330 RepID=UPI0008A1ED85|nr:hypothetical protein [Olsenella sp. HMSC062G07]OFK23540.1 hypothetical protein HMPREF2826_04515 [Olsenella sp. HMSC062G07]
MSEETQETSVGDLAAELDGPNRRLRQEAAHQIALLAKEDPNQLFDYAGEIIDGLDRPEAQTRWELLDALSEMVTIDPGCLEEAFEGAETSLFDEDSSIVRLAAFRFLATYGSTSPERSDQVWRILDEAVQCYHGDPEYRDMLRSLVSLAGGSISDQAAEVLRARVSFDAQNGRGYIRAYSKEIIEVLSRR